jgi:hypothetical protein
MKKIAIIIVSSVLFFLSATATFAGDNLLLSPEGGINLETFAQPSGEVMIELPDGEVFFAIRTGGGRHSWEGHLKEGEEYSINLSIATRTGDLIGSINGPDKIFQVRVNNGILSVDSREAMPHGEDVIILSPPKQKKSGSLLTAPSSPLLGVATWDIMILYDSAYNREYPEELLNARLEQLIQTGNSAYKTSGIPVKLRLVHAEKISAPSYDNQEILLMLSGGEAPFADIEKKRAQYGADLVALIRPLNNFMTSCGVGILSGDGNGNLFPGYTSPPPAFLVVADGAGCEDSTLTHEIGHSGSALDHDRANAAGISKKTGEVIIPAAYPYSYGYGVVGSYGTIMSYIYPKKLFFSGGPGNHGDAYANNIASITNTRWQTAGWLPTRIFENPLYFIQIETSSGWETELVVVNKGESRVVGTITGLNDNGEEIFSGQVVLSSGEKRILDAAEFFGDQNALVKSAIFSSPEAHEVVGYTEFRMPERYSVTVPAASAPSTGDDIYVPHIASNDMWLTVIGLLNTTVEQKNLAIDFSNGETRIVTLPPLGHKAFDIKSLFGGIPQKNIQSATIRNASGVVGMELFGSKDQLSGVPLKDAGEKNIVYPHVAGGTWWTGMVAYNPSTSECPVDLEAYSASGDSLQKSSFSISGKGRYIGTAEALGLPSETAWFQLDSSCPLVGFELFGTKSNQQLASYSGGAVGGASGVFAKMEDAGWTGIALVNTEDEPAEVLLSAYADDGTVIDTATISLTSHAKWVALVQSFFEKDVGAATHIAYQSDKKIVGLEISGSNDGKLLDALPAM